MNSGRFNYADSTSAINITYSDVSGGFAGEGNIEETPMFIDQILGDYHLT